MGFKTKNKTLHLIQTQICRIQETSIPVGPWFDKWNPNHRIRNLAV